MADKTYPGGELETFALAHNWKAYYAQRLAPHITGDVLEVGAGIGATARPLCSPSQRSWTCLEPDPLLAERLQSELRARPLPIPTRVAVGCVSDLAPAELFDCILYVDVLEHIADDARELADAARHLRSEGTLIVLSPAHDFLFSPFDQAIGHHRRYNARMLRAVTPPTLVIRKTFYLDSVGMLLSLANRVLLRSAEPSARQILFWDRSVIPLSRLFDRLFAHRVGKTVVATWQRARATDT
jgi:SAM-dependent methyltransferase